MNLQNIQNTIQEHMKTLPHDVQEAIHGSSWERKILGIGRKYGLHVDQLEILQTELSLAVLGLTGRDEFIRETMREAHIEKQMMDLIVVDINREIFEPIRYHLRKSREAEANRISNEEESSSGLEKHEEETLRKHGVSFDLNEEQEETPIRTPQQNSPIQNNQNTSSPQKVLTEPLVLKQKTSNPGNVSFEDLIQGRREREDQKPEPEVTKEEDGEQHEQEVSPFDVSINHDEHPVGKTDTHQTIINQSKSPIYTKGDPYREPIT